MPWADTAPRMLTEIRRLERSMTCSFCTNGSTKTLAPMMTFWPLMSCETSPVSGFLTGAPLRPVMTNASLGPATLMRCTIK